MGTVKLSNGVIMPMEGFGVFQIPEEACEQNLSEAELRKALGKGSITATLTLSDESCPPQKEVLPL